MNVIKAIIYTVVFVGVIGICIGLDLAIWQLKLNIAKHVFGG